MMSPLQQQHAYAWLHTTVLVLFAVDVIHRLATSLKPLGVTANLERRGRRRNRLVDQANSDRLVAILFTVFKIEHIFGHGTVVVRKIKNHI